MKGRCVMGIQLGDIAPDFTAESTLGKLKFHDYLGDDWGLLLSHHKDFTPVSRTEILALSKAHEQFVQRGVKVVTLSVDSIDEHLEWKKEIEAAENIEIPFPLVSDREKEVANLYDMIHPNIIDTMTLRDTFVINPSKMVMLRLTHPVTVGRNFFELLRVIDALQLVATKPLATPANWQAGEDCVVLPTVTDSEAKTLFPQGVRAINSYLKMTSV